MIEMLVFLGKVHGAVQSAQSVTTFFENELISILEAFGDVHQRAALIALRDAKLSQDRDREIASAITLLRPAYEAYLSAAQKKRFFGILSASLYDKENLYRKAAQVALLCAVAYSRLGEHSLVQRYVDLAQTSFDQYEQSAIKKVEKDSAAHGGSYSGNIFMLLIDQAVKAVGEGSVEKTKARLKEERAVLQETLKSLKSS